MRGWAALLDPADAQGCVPLVQLLPAKINQLSGPQAVGGILALMSLLGRKQQRCSAILVAGVLGAASPVSAMS
jgi:hypothetical protein